MHTVSDRLMAWPDASSSIRPIERHRNQQSHGDGNGLNLIVNLHPNVLLTKKECLIMEELGLDGHWLITAVVEEIPKQRLDLNASRTEFADQMTELLFHLDSELFNKIQEGYVAEGFDDDLLTRLDGWLEEHMPELLAAAEKILSETYLVLRNYTSPPHCRCSTVDKYFLGYSIHGQNLACLHFEFSDYENYRTFRS